MTPSPREAALEGLLLDYIERFGLTERARAFYFFDDKEAAADARTKL